MSESTEELATAVQGTAEELGEVRNLVEQLGAHAGELAEEAGGHGWHGMATRLEEAAGALQEAAVQVGTCAQECQSAVAELGAINDKVPAGEVVTHLVTSSQALGLVVSAVAGAVEKVREAETAVGEVGQEGLMQATSDLHEQLSEVHERVVEHQATSESERVAADAFATRQPGN